jgi:four helix bundle protein
MEKSNVFNEKYRERTRQFAIDLCISLNKVKSGESLRIIIRQLLRSGTSVAANFRAATRARSLAEYYSKLCIAVEECDETGFWFEILHGTNLLNNEDTQRLQNEATELLKIFATTKKKLKLKLNTKN